MSANFSIFPQRYKGATSLLPGQDGLVPAAAAGDQAKFFTGAGTYVAAPGGALPSQTGHAGNVLTTDGTTAAWTGGLYSTKVVYASSVAALNSNVLTGGGTDDTTALQTVLNLASSGTVNLELVMDGAALVTGLHIYSNTTIRCLNQSCGFYLKTQSNVSIVRNANPSATVVTDKHIAFIGGTYNGNSANQTSSSSPDITGDSILHGIAMYGVDDVKMVGVKTYYCNFMATMFSLATNVLIEDCENQNFSDQANDGYHFVGSCSQITVLNVKGTCGADFVALNATDYEDRTPGADAWIVRSGTGINHASVTNVMLQGSRNGVGIISGVSGCDDIVVRGVQGTCQNYAVSLWNPWSTSFDGGTIGTVILDNITAQSSFSNGQIVSIFSETNGSGPTPGLNRIKNLSISNVAWDPTGNQRCWLYIDAKARISSLTLNGVNVYEPTENTTDFPFIQCDGNIDNLNISNFTWKRPAAAVVNKAVLAVGSTSTVGYVATSNISTNRIASNVVNNGGTITLQYSNAINGVSSGTQFVSTVATGTAPFPATSTTLNPNLNAALLGGATFAAPGSIGTTTPGVGAFTSLTSTGAVTLNSSSGNTRVAGAVAVSSPITAAFTVGDGATTATSVGIGGGNIQTGGATSIIGAATQSGVTLSLGLAGSASGNSKAFICVPGGYSAIGSFGVQATGTKYVLYNNASDTDSEIGVGGTASMWFKSQGNGLTNAFEWYGNSTNSGTAPVILTLTKSGNATFAGNITASGTGVHTFSGPVKLPSYVVSGLPSASTSGAGSMAYVTDSTATAITGLGLAVVGSGSNKVVVVSDGTSWIVQ